MTRNQRPVALATLFVILLGWFVLYTQLIVRALRADVETLTQIYTLAQQGLNTTSVFGETSALTELQRTVILTGVPLVVTREDGSIDAAVNLPFDADLLTPEGQERVRRYTATLDARNDPIGNEYGQMTHFGDTPEIRNLRWIQWLVAAGLLLTVIVGFTVIRSQRRAESERAWTSMARELAHQLGTPISSLQGWLEVLRIAPTERPGDVDETEIATAIEEDLVRLERISHRFELIGREPELETLDLHHVVHDLERYLSTRLPRLGPGVRLDLDVPEDLPHVMGNTVLLAWALENVVKNALDALAGRGGSIGFRARWEGRWVNLRIRDSGPGVAPELRDSIFEPGVTSKAGGWGVGLALSRRIVEGVHGGRIELLEGRGRGAIFQILLPVAD